MIWKLISPPGKKTLLFTLLACVVQVFGQTPDIDSLLVLAEKAKGEEKIILLSDISYYSSYVNTDLSLESAEKCFEEAKEFGDSLLLAEAYNALAIALYAKSDYINSLENNKKALRIRLRWGDDFDLLSSYSKIGNCLSDLGRFDEALSYYYKSLDICKKNTLTRQEGLIINNIAQIYLDQKNYEKAEDFFLKSVEITRTSGDSVALFNALTNLGITNARQGLYKPADSLYHVALSIIKGKEYPDLEAGLYINFGVLCKEDNRALESINYYKKARDIYLKTGEIHGLAIVYSNIGNTFLESGNYDSAYIYYNEGVELAEATNSLTRRQYAYKSLSYYYYMMKDFRYAYMYDSISDVLLDSIFNIDKTRIIEELNTQYETEEKERKIAEQQIEMAEQTILVQRRNLQLSGSIGTLFIILLVTTLIYRTQKSKQAQLHQQIELEKIMAVNRVQDEKLRISRDLHDNIGSQLSFVVSSLDNLNYFKDETIRKEKLVQLGEFARETIAQLRETIWALNADNIALEQLSAKIMEFINHAKKSFPEIRFNMHSTPSEKILSAEEAINIYRAMQEVINNAIKHSGAKVISFEANENMLSLSDDGIGFHPGQSTTGEGLKNISERLKSMTYKANIDSAPGKGTVFRISLG